MKVICAPNNGFGNNSIFLAGGITGCPDWQSYVIDELKKLNVSDNHTIFNPRRPEYGDLLDEKLAEEQITWEFDKLKFAKTIVFWFPKETLCPITLYELGRWVASDKLVMIGVHPEYKRKLDIEIQTKLLNRVNNEIHSDLDQMIKAINAMCVIQDLMDNARPTETKHMTLLHRIFRSR